MIFILRQRRIYFRLKGPYSLFSLQIYSNITSSIVIGWLYFQQVSYNARNISYKQEFVKWNKQIGYIFISHLHPYVFLTWCLGLHKVWALGRSWLCFGTDILVVNVLSSIFFQWGISLWNIISLNNSLFSAEHFRPKDITQHSVICFTL